MIRRARGRRVPAQRHTMRNDHAYPLRVRVPSRTETPMSFLDKLRHKAEELDLETKAKDLAEAAAKAAQQAKEKAAEIAHEQRDRVEEVLDKAGQAIDAKTEGKYHDKVAKAKDSVVKGVDKLAEQRPATSGESPVAEPGPYFEPDAGAGSPAAASTTVPPADDSTMFVDAAAGDEEVIADDFPAPTARPGEPPEQTTL